MQEMNAIVLQDGLVNVQKAAIPSPQSGQVLVRSLACGICGSDIHITRHSGEIFNLYRELGLMNKDQDDHAEIMLGHEFCAEIVEFGPDTQQDFPIGQRITSVPILLSQQGAGVGVTPGLSGAYSEYFILDEALLLAVPDSLPSEAVALTEPLAVGLHAVNRSHIGPDDTALVVGCGPIGLAVVSALKRRGIKAIVCADLQDDRLQQSLIFGATHTVNSKNEDEVVFANQVQDQGRLVIFECVGIHTLINGFIQRAPERATLVITGLHTADSTVNYAFATVKELDIYFSYYYQVEEFAECLNALSEGEVPWQTMLTGKVGMDGIKGAFEQLMQPNSHIKVVIEPWRNGELESI